MAIRTYLQSLGAQHLLDLNNNVNGTSDDLGNSSIPTSVSLNSYSSFDTKPVCEGVTHSLKAVTDTGNVSGATIGTRTDINDASDIYQKYTIILWVNQADIFNTTCIYKQGGGTNNFAFMGGALTTWQAADSGEPFLIVQSKSLTQADRPYFLAGVWERYTEHAGSGNRVLFYINGVLQGVSELTGTDRFPSHGTIHIGNSGTALQSFAGATFRSQTVEKNMNFWATFNDQTLTAQDYRDIFERTTLSSVTIAADTVANQQAALDALSGSTFANVNCAFRIVQATDATDYRLFVDNINFIADPNLEDISVQFVGTGNLTLEDTNGTEIKYVSTPAEVETNSGILTGGGSITIVRNTSKISTPSTITNSQADKIVFETAGNYEISGGITTTVENISGGAVTLLITNNAPTPTIIGSNVTLTFPDQPINITNVVAGSRLRIYNVTTGVETVNTVVSGTSYTSSYQEGTDYSDGDTVRVYLTKLEKEEWVGDVIDTSNGFNVLASQIEDNVYTAMGVDGATVDKFVADYPNNQVDIQVAQNFSMAEFYAWWKYNLTSEDGIRRFFGGITAIDQANLRINHTVVNLFLDNMTSTNLVQTDNRRIYRTDGVYPVVPVTSGGGGIDIVWRNTILIAETGLKAKDSEDISAIVQNAANALTTTLGSAEEISDTVEEAADAIIDSLN